MIKNKKSQYNFLSPILIIGVVVFCIPIVFTIFGIKLDEFIKTGSNVLGIFLILIGAVFSMNKANRQRGY